MGFWTKIFRKKKGKKLDKLKLGALKELGKLKKQKFSLGLIEDLNKIFRIYIREKYKIKQSLTCEELSRAIQPKKISKKMKNKIIFLADKINNIEYKEGVFDKEKLNMLIDIFSEIIKGDAESVKSSVKEKTNISAEEYKLKKLKETPLSELQNLPRKEYEKAKELHSTD